MVWIPEDSKTSKFAIQKPVLVEEHHASGMHTERCTPSPRCGAHWCRGLYRLHHRTAGLQKQRLISSVRCVRPFEPAQSSLRVLPPEVAIRHLRHALCTEEYSCEVQPQQHLASERDEWGHRRFL